MLFLNLLKKMDAIDYILNKSKIKLFVYFLKKKKVFNSFITNFNSDNGLYFRGGQVIDQSFFHLEFQLPIQHNCGECIFQVSCAASSSDPS